MATTTAWRAGAIGAWAVGTMLAACSAPGGSGGGFVDCSRFPNAPVCGGGSTHAPGSEVTVGGGDGGGGSCDCDGRSCGPNSCNDGSCGSCGDGETCVAGACVAGECGAGGLTVSGTFAVASGIGFDQVSVGLVHKMDVDAFEDGCLTSIRVELGKGIGCKLVVEAGEAIANGGGLRVTRVSFAADSQCPGFPDDREGLYQDMSGLVVKLVVPGVYKVPDRDAPSACLATNLEVRLAGVLRDAQGRTLEVGATSLVVRGEMSSLGTTTEQCPCAAVCNDRDCGGDGCGYDCGACGANERCDTAQGQCECVPSCTGRECGFDGCSGSCGECGPTGTCSSNGKCNDPCAGFECGMQAGANCGTCAADERCGEGHCYDPCAGHTCGTYEGVACGTCGADERCNAGTCELRTGACLNPDDLVLIAKPANSNPVSKMQWCQSTNECSNNWYFGKTDYEQSIRDCLVDADGLGDFDYFDPPAAFRYSLSFGCADCHAKLAACRNPPSDCFGCPIPEPDINACLAAFMECSGLQ